MDLTRLDKSHVNAASAALAEAFFMDGLVMRMCADERNRIQAVLPVFRFSAGLAARNGEAWATSAQMDGVALWLYSWKMFCPPWTWLALGGSDIRRKLGPDGYRELTRVSDRIDRARESVAPERYLYLSCLGVQQEHRRQGLATALVRGRVESAAAEKLPTIVETNTEGARQFYEHVGFTVKTSFRTADMDYYVMEYR
jgi:ribosomal protein S18 acetylase RimI-like enzyme